MIMRKNIRIATRQSPLALWQAHFIGHLLEKTWPGVSYQLVPMLTSGDKFTQDKLTLIGGKGLFVKELEQALLAETADIAVHSMKDVPSVFPDGLILKTICKRDNPSDKFVSEKYPSLASLPSGALIGTTSLRRQAQILAYRPDLSVKALRGNVQTRLGKMQQGDYDAIILAAAGLERLQIEDFNQELIPHALMLPACGQGALGIECRENDTQMHLLLEPLNCPLTRLCVDAERAVNAQLGGNCHVPIAIYCAPKTATLLSLQARVLTESGQHCIEEIQEGDYQSAPQLALACASHLLHNGALDLIRGP